MSHLCVLIECGGVGVWTEHDVLQPFRDISKVYIDSNQDAEYRLKRNQAVTSFIPKVTLYKLDSRNCWILNTRIHYLRMPSLKLLALTNLVAKIAAHGHVDWIITDGVAYRGYDAPAFNWVGTSLFFLAYYTDQTKLTMMTRILASFQWLDGSQVLQIMATSSRIASQILISSVTGLLEMPEAISPCLPVIKSTSSGTHGLNLTRALLSTTWPSVPVIVKTWIRLSLSSSRSALRVSSTCP